jgi:hypothetical protein
MGIIGQACAFSVLLLLAGMTGGARAEQTVLRVVPHADLKILDPHTNTATITLMHGQMIYDTLFAWDEKLQPRPEMVDTYTVSPDKLVYTFTLRSGLKFHDGQKVTARDAVASIKRWMVRDVLGQTLAKHMASMDASDDNTRPPPQPAFRLCRNRARRDWRRHHARRGRDGRPLQGHHDDGWLGAVSLCRLRMEPRRQGRLRAQS